MDTPGCSASYMAPAVFIASTLKESQHHTFKVCSPSAAGASASVFALSVDACVWLSVPAAVDHYAARIDGAVVSCIQFTVCGVACCIGALIWGQPTFGQLQEGMGALLYAGVLSCGVGYTLQIVGQKGLNPTVAALIMSLESVIATISGWIAYKIGFLTTDQTLTPRQIAGCVIVFAAVILVQLPPEWFRFGKKNA